MGITQNDLDSDLGKILFTSGTKLNANSQLVISTGWLQRYTVNNVSEFNQGSHLNQYLTGVEYKYELRALDTSLIPGIALCWSNIYYLSESKKLGQSIPISLARDNYSFSYIVICCLFLI